jgi:hypothetical protein
VGVAHSISDAVREILSNGSPDGELPSLDCCTGDALEVARDVVDVGLPLLIVPDLGPKSAGLLEVKFGDLAEIPPGSSNEGFVTSDASGIVDAAVDGRLLCTIGQWVDAALVVGAAALRNECARSIALEVVDRDDRLVDWELLVVGAETVTVSIRVREETRLEDGIRRRLDEWDKVGGREGSLLNLGEVILRVLIQDELSNRTKGELCVRPDLGEIEDVPAEVLGLLWGHRLDVDSPGRVIARLDGVVKGFDTILRILSC